MGNNSSLSPIGEEEQTIKLDFVEDISNNIQLYNLNKDEQIKVVDRKDMNRIQTTKFSTLLEKYQSGFLWITLPSEMYEKFKEQILVVFYGKIVFENLDLDEVKLKSENVGKETKLYVVKQKANFLVVNK